MPNDSGDSNPGNTEGRNYDIARVLPIIMHSIVVFLMAISLTCTSLAYNDFRGRDLITVSNYEKFNALGTCVQFVTEKQLEHADPPDSWYNKDCDKQLWRGTLEVSVHGLYWATTTMGKGATNANLARVRQCHHLPSPSPPHPSPCPFPEPFRA